MGRGLSSNRHTDPSGAQSHPGPLGIGRMGTPRTLHAWDQTKEKG